MKLSSKSLYAVRALFNLAYHARGDVLDLGGLGAREDVPARFLEQIFQDLKKSGIVSSRRGPKGGYFLTRGPREVTLGQIIRAMEGDTAVSFCREQVELREAGSEPPASLAVTRGLWEDVAKKVDEVLDGVTLQDLVERGERGGVKREGYHEFVYVI